MSKRNTNNKQNIGDEVYIQCKKSIFNKGSDPDEFKKVLIIAYIRKFCSMFGQVNTTLDEIVSKCGYSISENSRTNNKAFKAILLDMINNKEILCNTDLETVKNSQMFTLTVNPEKDILYPNYSEYVSFTINEFNVITTAAVKSKKSTLLSVYLAIKQHIFISDNSSGLSVIAVDKIKNDAHIKSKQTVVNAINDLISLNLIYKPASQYYVKNKDGTYNAARTAYAIDKSKLINTRITLESYYRAKVYESKEVNN